MNITYAHLCEKAFLSQNGNLNLIGIFEQFASQEFPVSFKQLSLVTTIKGEPGKHQLQIKIINTKSGEEMIKPISLNLNIAAEKEGGNRSVRIIGDINNLVIKEPGVYEVQIFLNDEKAYSIDFKALQVAKPIPEGK